MGKAPSAFDRGTSRDDVDRSTFLSRMIDVARGLAILLVLLVHLEQDFSYYVFAPVSHRIVALLGMFEFGAAGVGLFFVISGYLLNLLYADDFNVRKYWVRRFARIYPAWLFWSLVAIVAAVVHAGPAYMGEPFYGQAVRLDSWPHIGIVVLQLLFLGFLVPATWNVFIPGGWSIQAEMFNYALYTFIRRLRFSAVLIGVLTLEILQAVLFPILGFSSSNIGVAQIVQSYMTAPVWFVAGMFLCRGGKFQAPTRTVARVELAISRSRICRDRGPQRCFRESSNHAGRSASRDRGLLSRSSPGPLEGACEDWQVLLRHILLPFSTPFARLMVVQSDR